ncbi:hypothetical protein C6P42_002439 [Pichia californica]|nr:hypothetical protein C6P42_002439 [[Candida] californica]
MDTEYTHLIDSLIRMSDEKPRSNHIVKQLEAHLNENFDKLERHKWKKIVSKKIDNCEKSAKSLVELKKEAESAKQDSMFLLIEHRLKRRVWLDLLYTENVLKGNTAVTEATTVAPEPEEPEESEQSDPFPVVSADQIIRDNMTLFFKIDYELRPYKYAPSREEHAASRRLRISQLKEIPSNPTIANVNRSLFHKNNSMLVNLIENINEISIIKQIQLNDEFKKNIVRFYSLNKSNFKNFTIENLFTNFENFLKIQKKLDIVNPNYYIQLIQLIDLMLICKSSNNEKNILINIRNDYLNCSFLQLPTISDKLFRKAICTSFQINDESLESKIVQLNSSLSKNQVVKFFNNNSNLSLLSNYYKESDFEDIKYYENWLLKSKNLENDMILLFNDPLNKDSDDDSNSFIPNQIEDATRLLIAISLNSTGQFFQGLIKCMQLWQINPFFIQFQFIKISSSMNDNNLINPELVEKAFNLSYLAMPFQIQFLEWPLIEKKNFLNLSMKIYNESIDSIKPFFGMFFQDQNSFTIVLSFLKLLKLNLKNIKQEIKSQLSNLINKRLENFKLKSNLNLNNLKLNNIVKFLSFILNDINLLSNWKFNNKDLNLSFQIFEIGSKILMTPSLDIIKKFISIIKSNNFIDLNDSKDKDNKVNFGTFIDLVNNLKLKTNFKYDFQNDIFDDFYKIVKSWNNELLNKTKIIIQNDNLIRLDGCSFSSSVQNLILLIQSYIKLLESFKWNNEFQSAELNIVLYKNIINSIKYYYINMTKNLSNRIIQQNNNENIDTFVCLNNIFNILEFVENLEKNPNVLKISKFLINNNTNNTNKSLNKYISVNIKNAENIENSQGNPLSLKVKLSGLINDETRIIMKDYNPDWIEEFNVIINGNNNNHNNLKIDLIDVESNSIYKSINYQINLNSESLFKNQNEKILLKPKSGSLNISVNVELEKNDPLFYIINCKNEIENSIKRSINFLIENYLIDFKKIFTIQYLTKSLIENPIRSENNYLKLQDPIIDSIIGNFKIKIIPTIYNNTETKLFDRLIGEFWIKILNIAENLLLPRISIINYKINSKLNKKNSSTLNSNLDSRNSNSNLNSNLNLNIHLITREELIRVVEWCYKFRSMLDLPDMILQNDLLNKPFDEFNEIKTLFNLSIKDLKKNYYQNWNYINRNMLNKLSKGIKFDRIKWNKINRNKELILRILLAKGEIKFVKYLLEIEQSFEKNVKTEIEVIYLQQFL